MYKSFYAILVLRSRHRNCPEIMQQLTITYSLLLLLFAFSQKPIYIYIRNMGNFNNTSGAIPPQISSDPP